jgi:DNA-directed RNA polymerase subunit beta'
MENKLDPDIQNTIIQSTLKNIIEVQFPIKGKTNTLELIGPLKIQDNLILDDYPAQKEIKLSKRSWHVPLVGSFRLIDNVTGNIIDAVENVKIANIPKMTPRFSMLIDGNEYSTMSQFRLKPGIYTRQKANDEMESQFNLAKGYNFKMMMDPADGIFYLYIANQKFNLYTLLHAFGMVDADIRKAWGQELFDKNQVQGINNEGKEIPLMWEKLRNQKLPYEKALENLKEYFENTKIDLETTALTIGKSFDKVTPEALLFTSIKLLKVLRGEEKEDERDSLIFKELNTVDDLLTKAFEKKFPAVQKNLTHRIDNKQKIKEIISPETYTKTVKDFFTQGDLSNPSPQTNPVEMVSEWRKTTVMGTGGIQSEHAITFKTRDVHPSHLGFLDIIQTPESGKVGITLPLPMHVRKYGKELTTRVYRPNGEVEYITPFQFHNMKIGLPDQHLGGKPKFTEIKSMYKGEPIVLPSKEVDAYLSHPTTMFSWPTNMIPFLANNSGGRALMGSKMTTQAVPLKDPEAPRVRVLDEIDVPLDSYIGSFLKPTVPKTFGKATVTKIDDNYITVKNNKGDTYKVGLYKDFPLNQNSYLHSNPIIKVGDKVDPLQPLTDLNFTDKNGRYAAGINANVAFMPWHGYNYEDGIVVTDSLAKRFTSTAMTKYSLQVDTKGLLNIKKFFAYFPEAIKSGNIAKLDENGVVKVGETVQNEDILVAYLHPTDMSDTEKILKSMHRMISQPFRNQSLVYTSDHGGVVKYVKKNGNTYDIYIKEEQPLVVGDKLAGFYGNKGIVTKIISDNEAPHTKDGQRMDMMVSVFGIPGRMNLGQIYEAAAGKWSMKTGKPYYVRNFSGENYLDDILNKLKEEKILADEVLLDGKDGKPTKIPIFWGNSHYMKLMHVVDHKFKARDLPGSYDANEQPIHGDEGGQSMDQMQMYAYLSHGAKQNLYETTAIKGQKNDEYWRALQLGFPPPAPQKNFVFEKMIAYMKAAGTNIQKNGYSLKLLPATSKDILSWSKGEIPDGRQLLRGKDLAELDGGLFDKKLTGGIKGQNWTHIKLNAMLPNPLYESPIKSLLGINSTQFDKIMNEDVEEGGITGGELIQKRLKAIDINKALEQATAQLKVAGPSQVNTLNSRVRYLQTLKKFSMRPEEAYMMPVLPILPPIMRPIYPLPSGDIQVAPINKHYRDIALLNDQIKQIKGLGLDNKEFNRTNRINLYTTLKATLGLTEPLTYTQEKYEGLLGTLAGNQPKQGFIQNKAWSKRQDLSARTTITVEPSLGVDEVGLPDAMSKKIFKPFVIRELGHQGFTPIESIEQYKNWTPIADKTLDIVMRTHPVILNRAPTLHKHGVQAFKPIRSSGLSMRLNPLIFKGFAADLDGDAMSVHTPISEKAIAEAAGMFPSKILFKAGDKGHMINIEQDYLLGLYFLSRPGHNTGKNFSSIEEAEKSIKDKQDLFTLSGKKMSLGQYYINELLPSDLKDYSRLLNNDVIKSILEQIYTKHIEDFPKIIDKWKELGRHYAFEHGATFSINDLVMDRKFRDDIIKKHEANIKPGMDKYEIANIYLGAKEDIEKVQNVDLSKKKNNLYTLMDSGAGGAKVKGALSQILSMPGIFTDIHGEPIRYPVKKSYAEGLDAFDYWNTSYATRKSVVDRSVNTQDSGALNKELLFNTKSLLIIEEDCKTPEGIVLDIGSKEVMDRYLVKDIPGVGKRNDLVDQGVIARAKNKKVQKLSVRSALTCEADGGICQKCYGLMANGLPPKIGENVGVIDSQALTERSTQLTLQTFHTGGQFSKTKGIVQQFPRLEELLKVPELIKDAAILAREDGIVRSMLDNPAGGKDLFIGTQKYYIPRERQLLVSIGSSVKRGDCLTDGSIKPQELSELKGHLNAQEYIADEINKVYGDKFSRKTFETVLKGISDNAELTKVPDHVEEDWLRGDSVSLTKVKKLNREFIKEGKEPIEYRPFFKSIDVLPLINPDWLSRLTSNRIKQTLQEAPAKGLSTNLKGIDPMPAYLYGLEFGQKIDPKKKMFY